MQIPHTLPLPISWKCSFIYLEHFSGSKLRSPFVEGSSPKMAPAGQAVWQAVQLPQPFSIMGNSLDRGMSVMTVASRTLLPNSLERNKPLLPTKPSPDNTAAVLCGNTP